MQAQAVRACMSDSLASQLQLSEQQAASRPGKLTELTRTCGFAAPAAHRITALHADPACQGAALAWAVHLPHGVITRSGAACRKLSLPNWPRQRPKPRLRLPQAVEAVSAGKA